VKRMEDLDISMSELARRAHITKSSLSKTLSKDSKQTTVMKEIHAALEWDAPPAFTKDSLEILALINQLDEGEQQRFIGRLQEAVAQNLRKTARSRTH
jgi:DNA transposition AAA+ family ATPase